MNFHPSIYHDLLLWLHSIVGNFEQFIWQREQALIVARGVSLGTNMSYTKAILDHGVLITLRDFISVRMIPVRGSPTLSWYRNIARGFWDVVQPMDDLSIQGF
jgi:hypothetical protein